jgi:acyl-CoA synthetase (AMP-forming)/AMP-acid ligase II
MASLTSASPTEVWAQVAWRRGDDVMVRDASGALSWQQCIHEVDQISASLPEITPGTLVMLAVPGDRRFPLCTLALWRRGATVIPVPVDATHSEIAHVERACGPQWLVSSDESPKTGHMLPRRLGRGLPLWVGRRATRNRDGQSVQHARFCQLTSGSTGAPKPVLISDGGILAAVRAQGP